MVHVSDAPPEIADVLSLLREGDIVTHCCIARTMKLVDDAGVPLEAFRRARDHGVLFDVGHGTGGFAVSSAEAIVSVGMPPDVISTDLHQMSRHASAVISNDAAASPVICLRERPSERLDLPLCISKLLTLRLSLSEVVAATRERPPSALGAEDELGTLRPGAKHDVRLFELVEGDFLSRDVFDDRHPGRQRLCNVQTFAGGRLLRGDDDADTLSWLERVASNIGAR